jgi:hypothetical protein
MKHLKRFNEAIIDWETDNIKSFYQELKGRKFPLSFSDLKEVGDMNDIEVVDYKTFYDELPNEEMKKDAPPRNAPAFATVNPNTNKARVVVNFYSVPRHLLDYIYHMLKHENIHIEQKRRNKDNKGEFLGDVRNKKEYFSNKDEIMAFSQSISDMVMDMHPYDMEEAIKMIEKTPLWIEIKILDDKVQKRYKKYIYLYLEKEFEKRLKNKTPLE